MDDQTTLWLTATLFALTYVAMAFGRVPGLRIDRAGIAMVGATLMLTTGLLSFEQAISPDAIDYKTIALLFGMMVVVGFLQLSGLLRRIVLAALERIRSPRHLLAVTIAVSGLLSAFLINDIVCLAFTPLVLHVARQRRFDPVPHLIALAMAANIGSAGAITGNPQNIYIGSHSGISYLRFAVRLMPVAALGLVLAFVVIAIVYRRQLATTADIVDNHHSDKNNSNELTEKMEKFFGQGKIPSILTNRLVNEYSHITHAVERGQIPIETNEILTCAKEIIKALESYNKDQYDYLMKSINE